MKNKIGICIDCGPCSTEKLLIAGRCHTHYWRHRSKVNAQKPKAKQQKAYKETLSGWFDTQIQCCSKFCENCGDPITLPTRTNIAHILPKSVFKEISVHPLNRWFACWQCHTNYDQWPADKVATMPVIKIAKARVLMFLHQVLQINQHRVPTYLIKSENETNMP